MHHNLNRKLTNSESLTGKVMYCGGHLSGAGNSVIHRSSSKLGCGPSLSVPRFSLLVSLCGQMNYQWKLTFTKLWEQTFIIQNLLNHDRLLRLCLELSLTVLLC